MTNIFFVGLGGLIGSISRYLVSGWVHRISGSAWFPFGTLTVNVCGCLLIGFAAGLAETRQVFTPELRLFIFLGVLGGFTTFSSFGYETFLLFQDHQVSPALLNIALHIVAGFAAVWAGLILARLL